MAGLQYALVTLLCRVTFESFRMWVSKLDKWFVKVVKNVNDRLLYLLNDGSCSFLLDIRAAFRHDKAVLNVQLLHIFKHLLMLHINRVLLLSKLFDRLSEHTVLLKDYSFEGRKQ